MNGIQIDAVVYRVRVVYGSLKRSFSIEDGPNSGTSIRKRAIRDIIGTGYAYEMQIEPDPRYPTDYDSFFDAVSAPVESHTVSFPYGQETLSFQAQIVSGADTYGGKLAGYERWNGLTLRFVPMEPQRS